MSDLVGNPEDRFSHDNAQIMSANFRKNFQYKQLLCYVEMANTVDPDEIAHYEPSNLDLQCLQIQLLLCLALYGLKAVAGLILNS